MAVQVVRFEPSLLPAVRRFTERTWRRPTSDAFYSWRYLESPLSEGFLALRDGEVLAALWGFHRPWRLGERTVRFHEVFDWYALPELQRTGLGVRILRVAMQEQDPCVVVGGTEDTRTLLPRMGWRVVDGAARFLLPLRSARVAATLAERAPIPGFAARPAAELLTRAWFRPRRRGRSEGRMIPTASLGAEAHELFEAAEGTRPLWPRAHLSWLLAGFPGVGHFVPLYFARGDELCGCALLRLYPSPGGCDAELVDLVARDGSGAEVHVWMVSEVARCAQGFGAGLVATTTSCPRTQQALRRNRFLRVADVPIHVWSQTDLALPEPICIQSNTNDGPLVPAAETWW